MDYDRIEQYCLSHMSSDYMPLNDVVRQFSGYTNPANEADFLAALEFLQEFSTRHKIRCLEGPDMIEIEKPFNVVLDEIRLNWYKEDYKSFNYGYWFEMG